MPERARAREVKAPEAAHDRAPPAARPPAAPARSAPRLPSPPVAAAILAGAEHGAREHPKQAAKRSVQAPTALASAQSPAHVAVEPVVSREAARAPIAPSPAQGGPHNAAPLLTAIPQVSPKPPGPLAPAAPVPGAAAVPETAAPPAFPAALGPAPASGGGRGGQGRGSPAEAEKAEVSEGPTRSAARGGAATAGEAPHQRDKSGAANGGPERETEATEGAQPAEVPGGAPAVPVQLHMPEPPRGPSAATVRRIQGVQARAGAHASAQGALPRGASQVADARKAVTEPDSEANARAQAALIAQVQAAPSPEIVKLCAHIKEVIQSKRPPDEDALMKAQPDAEAMNAGNRLDATVQGETKKVQDNYAAMNGVPPAAAPEKGQDLPPQPLAVDAPAVNAAAAAPDAVPPASVSLDADAEASKQKMKDAGMDSPAAQLAQNGPVAEARGAQGELDKAAKEDPAKVLAKQNDVLTKAESDMTALQAQALSALTTSRGAAVAGATTRQTAMVGSEASMREKASAEAKQAFDDAQAQVEKLLQPLASTAMAEWEAAKDLAVTKFKADLEPVQRRVDERHAGAGGFVVALWDVVAGLPPWAEQGYKTAEENFGDTVIKKLEKISTEVNAVIATCDLIIKTAREKIAGIFSRLPESLQAWAKEEQGKFDGQLDKLHDHVIAARDSFNKDLVQRSSQAVNEARAEIAELRKKAGGLVGRIAAAVQRFLDDPVKFIIEGILELLGIPPAAFWAVVAKIRKVVKDIADDPARFANNLLKGLGQGFSQFFDNILSHLLKGFLSWLTGGLGDVGVQLPKDLSLKSIVTFLLQLMGLTWPRIRKILAKHVGEKNVALLEKVYSLVSFLIEKGPEGIFELIKEKLDPQSLVDQVVKMAVDYMIEAVIKAAAARIILLFNPVGAIAQAIEAIYRVLKWVFENAARIFTLIETVVNGIADVIAGNLGGFANAVEKGLAMLIAPVISFVADYAGFGDLPNTIAEKIKSFQEWILGLVDQAIGWLVEKGKALLAALGIGGKDKDKKTSGGVGEDLGWTVGTESHHLWIAAEGEGHVPMVASGSPHPVATALKRYQEQADILEKTDEGEAKLARQAIKDAGDALGRLDKELKRIDALSKQEKVSDEDLARARDDVSKAEQALKDAVERAQEHLGLNDDERVQKAKANFASSPFSTREGLGPFLGVKDRQARAIVQKWKAKGIVFRVESASTDPEGMNTFDPAVAKWRETHPNNRQKYGYVNPKKTSSVGLQILSKPKGLRGAKLPGGQFKSATVSEMGDAGYHQRVAHYKSVLPQSQYTDFQFEDAILGHKPPGASGHWNDKGHKQTRNQNYEWNQCAENYHGPEHKTESAQSGPGSQRYSLPTKECGSNEMWWRMG